MHTFILQDYITIRGAAGATVTQNESGWLDLTPYQDLVFFTDVREFTGAGGVTMNLQTSPTKDEALFTNIIAALTLNATSPRKDTALMTAAGTLVPIARYLRWTATQAAAWDLTFRIYVAANSPGM